MDETQNHSAKPRRVDRFSERLKRRRAHLSPSLISVADYIDRNRHAVLGKSALEIAAETGTSDATVIRAIQALGFEGLVDLKDTLESHLSETDSPSEKMAITTGELNNSVDAAIDFVAADQMNAVAALSSPLNREGMARAVSLLLRARRIGVFGIGASGILATYAARLLSRNGYPAYALNLTGIALAEQLLSLEAGDVLVMMAHGRAHREGMATIAEAERLGIPIIMMLGKEDSVLRSHASAVLVMPRAKSEQVALHGPALFCLEAMVLALAGCNGARTVASLDRLLEIRDQIRPSRK